MYKFNSVYKGVVQIVNNKINILIVINEVRL